MAHVHTPPWSCVPRDEAAVLTQLEGIVSLLVPGFSILELWNEHGSQMGEAPGKVRDAVILVLHALDCHCPDAAIRLLFSEKGWGGPKKNHGVVHIQQLTDPRGGGSFRPKKQSVTFFLHKNVHVYPKSPQNACLCSQKNQSPTPLQGRVTP